MIKSSTNYVALFGQQLLCNSYPLIPIRPNSKKAAISAWQKTEATTELVDRWASVPAAGVGITTGDLVGVDIDCDDQSVVDKVVDFCSMMFGASPIRIGKPGRALLVFRADKARTKTVSKAFTHPYDPGDKLKLEVLGTGQYFVAYGVHPDTGKEYHWVGDPLHLWTPFDMASLSVNDVDCLMEYFENCMSTAGYNQAGSGRSGQDNNDDLMEGVKPVLDISDDHVTLVMASYSATDCDYDDWIEMGMALHHQYGGDEISFDLWDTWSQESEKYEAKTTRDKWVSFHDIRGGSVVTFATILHKSGVSLAGEDPLGEMLKNYAHIANGDQVVDLRKLPHVASFKLTEFKNHVANVRKMIKDDNGRPKIFPVSALWLINPMRKSAVSRLYRPGNDQLFSIDGTQHYNSFNLPRHAETTATDKMQPFIDHVTYLYPVAKERTWFLDWLAHTIQYPEARPPTSVLHIAKPHGTGRGLLNRTIRALVGDWNCGQTTIKDIVDGDFNEFFYETLFVFVDETKAGGNRYEVSDKMRDKLADRILPINVKSGFKGDAHVFSRVFMSSNHYDGLKIPIEDRRVNVFSGPEEPLGSEHYQAYGDVWLNDPEGIAQVFNWLKRRDISSWDMQRSMDTKARSRMLEFTRNDTEALFFELLGSPPSVVMTQGEVVRALLSWDGDSDDFDDDCVSISDGQVRKLLQEHCEPIPQMMIDGKRVRLWNMQPKRKLSKREIREMRAGKLTENVRKIH